MPLVYRDLRCPRPDARRPAWIPLSASLERCEHDQGDFVGQWDPMIFRPSDLPKDVVWHDVGDDWRLAVSGDLDPRHHLRTDPGRPLLIPVADRLNRCWHAPAVLTATGSCALSLSLGKDAAGNWARQPTPEQARLLAAAHFIRGEIEAKVIVDGEEISRFSQLPIGIAADNAAIFLEAVYCFNLPVLSVLGVLDDTLMQQLLLSAVGFPLQARQG